MAFHRQGQLAGRYSAAIIAYFDQAFPGFYNFDRDLFCPGIQRVLDQLLNDRGWSLNHFPRRDLRGDFSRQDVDWHEIIIS